MLKASCAGAKAWLFSDKSNYCFERKTPLTVGNFQPEVERKFEKEANYGRLLRIKGTARDQRPSQAGKHSLRTEHWYFMRNRLSKEFPLAVENLWLSRVYPRKRRDTRKKGFLQSYPNIFVPILGATSDITRLDVFAPMSANVTQFKTRGSQRNLETWLIN